MSTLTAEQIRQGLSLPNNEAGRVVAEALVEQPGDATELEGFLSAADLAESGRIMKAFRGLSLQQQVDLLTPLARGLQAPVNIRGTWFQVSTSVGAGDIQNALQIAEARVANPNATPGNGGLMDLQNPAQGFGRELLRNQFGMMVEGTSFAVGGTMAAVGIVEAGAAIAGGAIAAGTFPIWGTVILVGGGLALAGWGASRLYNRLF
jgi:hypothetical protein